MNPTTYEDAIATGWTSTGSGVISGGLYTVTSPDGSTTLSLPSAAASTPLQANPAAVSTAKSFGEKLLVLGAIYVGYKVLFHK
jgi:hypothetical protein